MAYSFLSYTPQIIVHASAVGIMTAGYQGLEKTVMDSFIRPQVGGHFQFLTIQALAMSWLTMVASLVCDFVPSFAAAKSLKRLLLMTALQISVVVTSIYWPLMLFFPSLILQSDPRHTVPSSAPDLMRIPLSLDLALHASPVIYLLIDLFAFEAPFTRNQATYGAGLCVAAFSLWYSSWVEYCAKHNGSFPYPFLDNPLPVRIVIYFIVSAVSVLSFRGINNLRLKLFGASSGVSKQEFRSKKQA